MTLKTDDILIKVECNYVTVEEFSKIQNVPIATVQQWICQGKLRYAKKIGEQWLIPSTEDKPLRKYEPVQYLLDKAEPLHLNEFPFVSLCDSVYIFRDDKKSKYICSFDKYETKFHNEVILNRQEVEALEYALISSGKANPNDILLYRPLFK